jgi:hypothetical protein
LKITHKIIKGGNQGIFFVIKMSLKSKRNLGSTCLGFLSLLLLLLVNSDMVLADIDYEMDYQDPAGDVLQFNESWSQVGTVETQPQIDIKWLRSSNDTLGNVVLRMEFKNNQIIEESNETRYVFRIFTSLDNTTGYNVTYQNETAIITNFNHTLEEDIIGNASIIDDNGEALFVEISKNKYLANISYYNIDAFTWKEQGNMTYIDYVSEIPGHPGETGDVVDEEDGESDEDKGLFDDLCGIPLILIIVLIIIVVIIILVYLKVRI